MDSSILVLEKNSILPPIPTRDTVCGIKLTFAGLVVTTKQYGTQPWFEPAYQTLDDKNDRLSVIAQKKKAGDTHLILEFFENGQIIYDEPGQPWNKAYSKSGYSNQGWFRSLVIEVIQNGLIPIVVYDGDDGVQGAIRAATQLPILSALLKDLSPYILFARLWDGVFYGAEPSQIYDFGKQFRFYLPNGYLGIEHNPGHIPCGEGDGDWINNGGMTTYDVIFSEFDYPDLNGKPNDTIWQIAARLLGPYYIRPSDQPSDDDPGSPFPTNSGKYYLRQGNSRGQYFPIAFEWWATYNWVRIGNPLSSEGLAYQKQIQDERKYLLGCGYKYSG